MKKFIKFTAHYYMDEYPFETIQAMDPEKAQDYINYMNSVWGGGTYSQKYHVMTPDEALKYVISVIENEKASKLEDSEEFIDDLLSQLKECYNIDYKPLNN